MMVAMGAALEESAGTYPPVSAEPMQILCSIACLLDALQCGAFLLDRGGRMVHVNPRLCEMLQRTSGELTGRTLFDLYPAGDGRAAIQDALEHFDESREREFYLPRADGSQLPVIVSG